MDKTIRVMLVEDHDILRFGLVRLLDTDPGIEVRAAVGSGRDAIERLRQGDIDVVMLDLTLPDCHGVNLTRDILRREPSVRVIVLTMHDEQRYGVRAIAAGATAYLMKTSPPEIVVEAVRRVGDGGTYISDVLQRRLMLLTAGSGRSRSRAAEDVLSNRELEVLQLIGNGMSSNQIAATLRRSVKTVEAHRENIKKKLVLRNASELTRFAFYWCHDAGIQTPESPQESHDSKP